MSTIIIENGEMRTESQPRPAAQPIAATIQREKNSTIMEVPTRLFHVVAAVGKDATRYSIDAVLVKSVGAEVEVVATDGKRLMIATCTAQLYDAELQVLIPSTIARAILSLSPKAVEGEAEPMATITVERESVTVAINRAQDNCQFVFEPGGGQYPPYRDVVPDWSGSTGTGLIGITPKLVASTLQAMIGIVGADTPFRVYLPSRSTQAFGFEAREPDANLRVLAVVMPAAIPGCEPPPKPAKAPADATDDPDAPDSPADLTVPAAESWRIRPLSELHLADATNRLLVDGDIHTLGQLSDLMQRRDWRSSIKGIGQARAALIEMALQDWFNLHPDLCPPVK